MSVKTEEIVAFKDVNGGTALVFGLAEDNLLIKNVVVSETSEDIAATLNGEPTPSMMKDMKQRIMQDRLANFYQYRQIAGERYQSSQQCEKSGYVEEAHSIPERISEIKQEIKTLKEKVRNYPERVNIENVIKAAEQKPNWWNRFLERAAYKVHRGYFKAVEDVARAERDLEGKKDELDALPAERAQSLLEDRRSFCGQTMRLFKEYGQQHFTQADQEQLDKAVSVYTKSHGNRRKFYFKQPSDGEPYQNMAYEGARPMDHLKKLGLTLR